MGREIMKHAIFLVVFTLTLNACATTRIDNALETYNQTPVIVSMLKSYVGDDEQANTQLYQHIKQLETYYIKAQDVDSTESFMDFYDENAWQIHSVVAHWAGIKAVVGQYAQRTQQPVPQELERFRMDVEAAYKDLAQIVVEQDRNADMVKYLDMLALLAKLAAAGNGVIL